MAFGICYRFQFVSGDITMANWGRSIFILFYCCCFFCRRRFDLAWLYSLRTRSIAIIYYGAVIFEDWNGCRDTYFSLFFLWSGKCYYERYGTKKCRRSHFTEKKCLHLSYFFNFEFQTMVWKWTPHYETFVGSSQKSEWKRNRTTMERGSNSLNGIFPRF